MSCLHAHRGSAIAKIVGANAAKYDTFDSTVKMWVFEETVNGRKLSEIINTDHENVKYLPGHKLPHNVVRLLLMSIECLLSLLLCVVEVLLLFFNYFPLASCSRLG